MSKDGVGERCGEMESESGDDDSGSELIQQTFHSQHIGGSVDVGDGDASELTELLRKLFLKDGDDVGDRPTTTTTAAVAKKTGTDRRFWDTQPVTNSQDSSLAKIEGNGPLREMDVKEVRVTPYRLIDAFEWTELDLTNNCDISELYVLLNENYVEDDDNMFRFDYSKEFLQWALCPPNFRKDWHIGVRVKHNKKLVGFISAIPANIRVRDKILDTVEINYLCVHKRLRGKRLAPVLIMEITRRVNLTGRFQATYTSGTKLPGIIGQVYYWHRCLNVRKLLDVKFTFLRPNMTAKRMTRLLQLPDETHVPGFRAMKPEDFEQAHALLAEHLKSFDLVPIFDFDEFKYLFTSREGVVYSFVVENPKEPGKITDFCSFYILPSTVVQYANNPAYRSLVAAYLYYNAPLKTPLTALIKDLLITAKNMGCDVFNALELQKDTAFLRELKFGIGDGALKFYLYNWRTSKFKENEIGLVLL